MTRRREGNTGVSTQEIPEVEILGDLFDSSKFIKFYQIHNQAVPREAAMVDLSDALGNDGANITFDYQGSHGMDSYVSFKAFITSYNESYNCDWENETVYGRIDSIPMFKQTTRSISLSFVVPAATTSEGYQNLYKVDKLRSFLYASYDTSDNALSINQSPLTRVNVMGLLNEGPDRDFRNQGRSYESFFGNASAVAGSPGALCVINNLSIIHNLENPTVGVFVSAKKQAASESDSPIIADHSFIVPKLIEVSLELTVIHRGMIGHLTDQDDPISNYVYNIRHDTSVWGQTDESRAQQLTQEDENRADETSAQATRDGRFAQRKRIRRSGNVSVGLEYSRRQARQIQRAGLTDDAIYFVDVYNETAAGTIGLDEGENGDYDIGAVRDILIAD